LLFALNGTHAFSWILDVLEPKLLP
jgi:hypothetical protein